jgi:hypothetical protein
MTRLIMLGMRLGAVSRFGGAVSRSCLAVAGCIAALQVRCGCTAMLPTEVPIPPHLCTIRSPALLSPAPVSSAPDAVC